MAESALSAAVAADNASFAAEVAADNASFAAEVAAAINIKTESALSAAVAAARIYQQLSGNTFNDKINGRLCSPVDVIDKYDKELPEIIIPMLNPDIVDLYMKNHNEFVKTIKNSDQYKGNYCYWIKDNKREKEERKYYPFE